MDTLETTLRAINARLDQIERIALLGAKSIYTIKEAAMFAGYSPNQFARLVKSERIPCTAKGRRRFFKREDLEWWLTYDHDRELDEEAEQFADDYIAMRRLDEL